MVSLKHKVTLRRKVAQEEELENKNPSSNPSGKSSTTKIIGGLVAAAVIIAGGVFFVNKGKDNGNSNCPTTETASQTGKKPTIGSNDSTTEQKGKTAAMVSTGTKGKPAANEAQPEFSVADEGHVTKSTEKSPTSLSDSEKPKNIVDGDVETNAHRVIRGDFGNGQERKDRLGSSYSEIQGRVNEMYRQGLFR